MIGKSLSILSFNIFGRFITNCMEFHQETSCSTHAQTKSIRAHSQNKCFASELANGLKVAVRYEIAKLIPNGYLDKN